MHPQLAISETSVLHERIRALCDRVDALLPHLGSLELRVRNLETTGAADAARLKWLAAVIGTAGALLGSFMMKALGH